MQLKIDLPEILPHKKIMFLIKEIEDILSKEGIPLNIKQESLDETDPWDNLNFEDIAVDTGIEDFAKNHDHYLYETPKLS